MSSTDITQFTGTAVKFDDGIDLVIKHPVSGEDTPIIIRIASYRSERVKRVQRKMTNLALVENKRNPKKVSTVEELEDKTIRLAASSIISWNITADGEPVPCTPESAFKLLSNPDYFFVAEQLDEAANNDALFMKP